MVLCVADPEVPLPPAVRWCGDVSSDGCAPLALCAPKTCVWCWCGKGESSRNSSHHGGSSRRKSARLTVLNYNCSYVSKLIYLTYFTSTFLIYFVDNINCLTYYWRRICVNLNGELFCVCIDVRNRALHKDVTRTTFYLTAHTNSSVHINLMK